MSPFASGVSGRLLSSISGSPAREKLEGEVCGRTVLESKDTISLLLAGDSSVGMGQQGLGARGSPCALMGYSIIVIGLPFREQCDSQSCGRSNEGFKSSFPFIFESRLAE